MYYYWHIEDDLDACYVTYRLTLTMTGSESEWMVPGTYVEREE